MTVKASGSGDSLKAEIESEREGEWECERAKQVQWG